MIRNTRDVVSTTGIALLERGRSKCRVSGSICPVQFHWSGPMVHQAGPLRLSFLVVRTLHEFTLTGVDTADNASRGQRGAEITHNEYTGRRDHAKKTDGARAHCGKETKHQRDLKGKGVSRSDNGNKRERRPSKQERRGRGPTHARRDERGSHTGTARGDRS